MADRDEATASEGGNKTVDEVAERLLDKADASGAALLGEGRLPTETTKAILERALEAEMSEHLRYERGDLAGHDPGNSRNGHTWGTNRVDPVLRNRPSCWRRWSHQ
ncbi:hypothetical protein ACFXPT_29295 [Streptomyces goshikiensis]|uniref:hypothetical protein n=1 Tax=Streptomyces goshikiensis TaxID=1942 RepID=UPI0036836A35